MVTAMTTTREIELEVELELARSRNGELLALVVELARELPERTDLVEVIRRSRDRRG